MTHDLKFTLFWMAAQTEGVTKAIASFYWDDWETVFPSFCTIYIAILYLPTFSESNTWDFTLSRPRFPETSRRLPKISDEFPKTFERCRKLNVRRLFPKTFEHFWSYLKEDTFRVLWYDFVRTQKRTQSHHVLRTICWICESGVIINCTRCVRSMSLVHRRD